MNWEAWSVMIPGFTGHFGSCNIRHPCQSNPAGVIKSRLVSQWQPTVSQVGVNLPFRGFVEDACCCLWNGIYWCWWLQLYSQQRLWVPGNGDSGRGHRPAPSCSCWGDILKSLFYSDWDMKVYLSCPMRGSLLGSGGHYRLPAEGSRRGGSLPAGCLTRWLYVALCSFSLSRLLWGSHCPAHMLTLCSVVHAKIYKMYWYCRQK